MSTIRGTAARVPTERPSTVSHFTGSVRALELNGPGFIPSNSTTDNAIVLVSVQRGSVGKTVQDAKSCRLGEGAPSDDDEYTPTFRPPT